MGRKRTGEFRPHIVTISNSRKYYIAFWNPAEQRSDRVSTGTSDKETANRKLAEFVAGLESPPDRDEITINIILDGYMAYKETHYRGGKHARSYSSIKAALKPVREYFGHLFPDQIDRALCRRYKMEMAERYSMASIHKQLTQLAAALNFAYKERWIDRQIFIEKPRQSEIPVRGHEITVGNIQKEIASLIAAADDVPHIRLFIMLAFFTGSRKTAICELTWDRVDLDNRLIHYNRAGDTNTNKRRTSSRISGALYDELCIALELAMTDYVIEYNGKPVLDIKKAFATVRDNAALPHMTPHMLRHYGATMLAMSGVDPNKIAEFLNDSLKTVMKHYIKFHPDYMKDVTEVLSIHPVITQPCVLPNDYASDIPAGINGAGDEIRTHDPNLGNTAISPPTLELPPNLTARRLAQINSLELLSTDKNANLRSNKGGKS